MAYSTAKDGLCGQIRTGSVSLPSAQRSSPFPRVRRTAVSSGPGADKPCLAAGRCRSPPSCAGFSFDADGKRLDSHEELPHIGLMASRAASECPRHLVALLGELNDYWAHSRRCDGDQDHDAIQDDLDEARSGSNGPCPRSRRSTAC